MSVQIIRGDARTLPLADNSVDLIVTSPPYFGLRSYQDNGVHYSGQLGDEATPAEFVDALIACTAEWMRVLKPSGSMWVNLGDKYNAYSGGAGPGSIHNSPRQGAPSGNGLDAKTIRPKSLIGIPWRYALRCIDDLGLILRSEVIWSKPNGLPESVTDRVRRSHEQWFMFTMQPRYFSAVDEIREAHARVDQPRMLGTNNRTQRHETATDNTGWKAHEVAHNPLGKLPGSVWTVPTEPLRVPESLGIDHFAAYPTEWPRRIIQGWSPSGVCVECGEGRRPIAVRASAERHNGGQSPIREYPAHHAGHDSRTLSVIPDYRITGYTCNWACSAAPTRPAVVLDPFGGTGTTALVAHALGRHGISNDMSADYCRLAAWRTSDPGQIAKVRGERKPVEQIDGQEDLFGEVSA